MLARKGGSSSWELTPTRLSKMGQTCRPPRTCSYQHRAPATGRNHRTGRPSCHHTGTTDCSTRARQHARPPHQPRSPTTPSSTGNLLTQIKYRLTGPSGSAARTRSTPATGSAAGASRGRSTDQRLTNRDNCSVHYVELYVQGVVATALAPHVSIGEANRVAWIVRDGAGGIG